MNVGVIERRLIDELDDDTDESIEGSPRRISAQEMNNRLANHLRVSAERNGVDLGPRKDLAASLAEPLDFRSCRTRSAACSKMGLKFAQCEHHGA